MNDQKLYWNKLHTEGTKAGRDLRNPTEFAIEVQSILPTKSKILELGCGVGNDSYFFAQKGHTVFATDYSEIAIEKNKSNFHQENLEFEVLDMSKSIPFPENSFDVIYARLSLHYFTDEITGNILKELHRILKPYGFLCFLCKSTKDSLYVKGDKIEKDMFEYKGHIRHFFSEEYVRDCLGGNFRMEQMTSGNEKFYNRLSAYIKVIARNNK